MGYIQLLGLIMGKIHPFRIWYYFRQGYQMYFAFIFAGINTMVITYYLAIERAPFLKEIFPTFPVYAVVLILVGFPILIFAGYVHFKRIPAFKSQQEINVISNPFQYKLGPGWRKNVNMPYDLLMSKLMIKLLTNQKITDNETKEMQELQKKMGHLIKGGYVGDKSKGKLPFDLDKIDD